MRRLLFSSIVVAQFIAFSAIGRDDAFRGQTFSSGNGTSVTVTRAEDPVPCPDCAPNDPGGGPPELKLVLRAEDPVPCPDCEPDDPGGGPPGLKLALRAEDPVPCPDCEPDDPGGGPPGRG